LKQLQKTDPGREVGSLAAEEVKGSLFSLLEAGPWFEDPDASGDRPGVLKKDRLTPRGTATK
jgi:hypothetical protein